MADKLTKERRSWNMSRETLDRTLFAKGHPILNTLLAVLMAVGMKQSVEPEHPVTAWMPDGQAIDHEILMDYLDLPLSFQQYLPRIL